MAFPNRNNSIEWFDSHRKQVLQSNWLVDLDTEEVENFLASLKIERFASFNYKQNHYSPFIQPRGGFPTFIQQKKLSEQLDSSGADFIPLTIDSYTRHNDYEKATFLLKNSEESGIDYLNGYPLINHGHKLTREIYLDINKPISLRHGTPDPRILIELAIASGITEIEGGAICYTIPYSKNFPIDRAIFYWQYVDRLCAEYSTKNRLIHRESFGPLTATMVPPLIIIVTQLIELLLSAEQGVKSFGVSFGQTGSFIQDIAIADILITKARTLLDNNGFEDVNVYLVYHQWMGSFPNERIKSESLICLSALIAKFIQADKIVIKTRDEAVGIPSISSNCDAVKQVKYIFNKMNYDGMINIDKSSLENELLSSQVEYLLDNIFNINGLSFIESVIEAINRGYIDIPYSPHDSNPNKLQTLRDSNNSIRIKDNGLVPMQEKDIAIEKELLNKYKNSFDTYYDNIIHDINIMI